MVILKAVHVSKVITKWNEHVFVILLGVCYILDVVYKLVHFVVDVIAFDLWVGLEWVVLTGSSVVYLEWSDPAVTFGEEMSQDLLFSA
jgi:hypothetical protein